MKKTILFLGPLGSYTDIAKDKFIKHFNIDCEIKAFDSIYKIIRTLDAENSEDFFAVIPIENSIEGIVRDTQDNLIKLAEKNIRIVAETNLKINHSLIGYGTKEEAKIITSHPQALAQCRDFIYENWKDSIELAPVLSTSKAVSSLMKEHREVVAIGSEYCAKLYNVPIIESEINDEKNNTTRFVLLGKVRPKLSDCNKISITFSTENKPGALNKVLNIIEKYGLNMSYIDSRPSRKKLGEYVFYIDFEGHIDDSKATLALTEIQPYVSMFEILSEGANCIDL